MPPHIVDLNDWQVDEWPSTPEGEARQAREIKEMYTVLFEHPLIEAITTWDFNDGCWLKAPSGLVRIDGTEKPAYHVLRKLIHEDWETHEKLVTDENGCITVNGFKGCYQISDGRWKGTFSLDDDTVSQIMLSDND